MNILIAVIVFSVIIIFHELGHFSLAKANGIRVNEFCLGLGPTLIGKTIGETKYSLKLLPFGGACIMEGEDENSADERAFNNKGVWARISVVAAGPIFNFIMAFLLALVIMTMAGYDKPTISAVAEESAAQQAGLQEGDLIKSLNGKKIVFSREVSLFSYMNKSKTVDVVYERDGKTLEQTLTLQYDKESGRYLMGIYGNAVRTKARGLDIFRYSVREVRYWIVSTVDSLEMLVTQKVTVNDLSGPVGIVKTIGDTVDESKASGGAYLVWMNLINISILLSANLGVMNLLPLPALDGGRLVFLLIELIRGKRVSQEKEGMVHLVGMFLLMALMVFVMFNDIRKLFL